MYLLLATLPTAVTYKDSRSVYSRLGFSRTDEDLTYVDGSVRLSLP